MLSFALTISTLALLPTFGEKILNEIQIVDFRLCKSYRGSSCFGCAFLRNNSLSSRSKRRANEIPFILCLKIGKRHSKWIKQELDAFLMNSTGRKGCTTVQGGNGNYRATMSNVQKVIQRCSRKNGDCISCVGVSNCFHNTRRWVEHRLECSTLCVVKLNKRVIVNTVNKFSHVVNICVDANCFHNFGVLIQQVGRKPLVFLSVYKRSRLVNQRVTTEISDKQIESTPDQGEKLRMKRNVFGNMTTLPKNSTYFTSDTNRVSPSLSTTPSLAMLSQHQAVVSSVLSTPKCPEYAVVNNLTIHLTQSASKHFRKTLVPTSQLTPAPRALFRSLVLINRTDSSVFIPVSSQTSIAPSPTRNFTELRTSEQNITYIYSSRLVSIVKSAQNASYVFITTWDCASVTKETRLFSSSSPLVAGSSTSPPKINGGDKKMKLTIILAAGGTFLAFFIIIVLVFLIRRYRRIQSLRRKNKQISYFNRYDRSSAWDEEPFGGSRLSVFTLKNSKFDIADWESTDGKKQDAKMKDDYESR